MPIRNQNWYNLQSTRRYPLDDKSTGISDDGSVIREDIIVDCHIRFAPQLGGYMYIQGINVSTNLVTVVLGAAPTLDATDDQCTSVAVVSIAQPVTAGVNYALRPLQPGIAGWITFGAGIDNNFIGRYSTPAQTFLNARNARPYYELPVPSLGKLGVSGALTGLVSLTADNPVTATYYENYALPQYDPETDQTSTEHPVRAIVFSAIAPTAEFNPYEAFLGPCGQRPESDTCATPPLERINGLPPDCETGNINIAVGPGLTVRPFAECGGLDITTPKKLSAACAKNPPSEENRRDECCDNIDGESEFCWPAPSAPDAPGGEEPPLPAPTLPATTFFRGECLTSATSSPPFDVIAGSFIFWSTLAPPSDCEDASTPYASHRVWLSQGVSGYNVGLYRAYASDWAYDRTVSAEFKPQTDLGNGGVILNRVKIVENGATITKYILGLYDSEAQELQIWRYTGAVLVKEAQTPVPRINDWYKISVTATLNAPNTTITARLYRRDNNATLAVLETVVSDYEAVNGRVGIIARAAKTYFNKFEVQ